MGITIKHHIKKLPNKVRNLVTDDVYTLEITQMNKDLWRVEYTNHSIKETTFLSFGKTKKEAVGLFCPSLFKIVWGSSRRGTVVNESD